MVPLVTIESTMVSSLLALLYKVKQHCSLISRVLDPTLYCHIYGVRSYFGVNLKVKVPLAAKESTIMSDVLAILYTKQHHSVISYLGVNFKVKHSSICSHREHHGVRFISTASEEKLPVHCPLLLDGFQGFLTVHGAVEPGLALYPGCPRLTGLYREQKERRREGKRGEGGREGEWKGEK